MVIFSERNAEAIMPDAAEWEIHHVNLQAADVRRSTDFLKSCAGLQEGQWRAPEGKGDFSIDPADLSIFPIGDFNGGLHIIKPDPGFAKRNNFAHNPSIGGHPAIEVSDLMGVKSRLENAGVEVSDAGTYAMAGMHQIYCLDPTGNMIEVNQRVR
jgi:catechol 2,3-dioxygenase-like lactoylglutathione lyase family enzyme